MKNDADDEYWMSLALAEARVAGAAGDVPVGAVIAIDGMLIGKGHNRREQDGDPTAHAEVVALRDAAAAIGRTTSGRTVSRTGGRTWRVEGTLYVTQEPCPMCAGAIVNARVRRVVYGCANPKAGAVETLYQIVSDARLNHRATVTKGVLASECAAELSAFFARLR